jgi:peptidoglycan/LPS O-acetylase OafA/YrhL
VSSEVANLLTRRSWPPQFTDASPRAPSCLALTASYYARRAAAVLPGYAAGVALAWAVAADSKGRAGMAGGMRRIWVGACPRGALLNLTLRNNNHLAPGCGAAYWSMAPTLQWYLACPLLLWALRPRAPGFDRRLLGALGLLGAASMADRVRTAVREQVAFPIGYTYEFRAAAARNLAHSATYVRTAPRALSLAAGAAAGLLLRRPAAVGWLRARGPALGAASLGLAAAAAAGATLTGWHGVEGPLWSARRSYLFSVYLWCGSPLYAAAVVAGLLALVVQADAAHAAAGAALASRPMRRLARLSSGLYFFHVQAMYAVLRGLEAQAPEWWGGLMRGRPGVALAVLAAATAAGGCAAAGAAQLAGWAARRAVGCRRRVTGGTLSAGGSSAGAGLGRREAAMSHHP